MGKTIKRLITKIFDLLKRFDPREDDEIIVRHVKSQSDIFEPDEKILWKGAPSPRYAWADHDQMEPSGATGGKPGSVKGRKIMNGFTAVFILFMSVMGAGSIYAGLDEILNAKNFGGWFIGIFLILLGLTLMSGLPFLFRPYVNSRRARNLRYVITSQRALILRRGHALSEIWVKSPVIFFVSLLFLVSVLGFSFIYGLEIYKYLVWVAAAGAWAAQIVAGIFFMPIGFVFGAIGWIGLRFQTEIIRDAIVDRSAFFVRSFYHTETRQTKYPKVKRLRSDGTGDVILSTDQHWEYSIDISSSPWLIPIGVGFFSVPDAEQVARRIRDAIRKK